MLLRLYLFSLYAILFISAGFSLIIVFNVNPFQSPFWMILIFYITIFLFWTAIFSLIGYYFKVWATNREIIFSHLLPTLRQSMLIAVAIIGLLFLQQLRVLNWWVGALLVVATFFIELYFRKEKYAR